MEVEEGEIVEKRNNAEPTFSVDNELPDPFASVNWQDVEAVKALHDGYRPRHWFKFLDLPSRLKQRNPMTPYEAKVIDVLDDDKLLKCQSACPPGYPSETPWDSDEFSTTDSDTRTTFAYPETDHCQVILKIGTNDDRPGFVAAPAILGWMQPFRRLRWPLKMSDSLATNPKSYRARVQEAAKQVAETVFNLLRYDAFDNTAYWKRHGLSYVYTNIGFAAKRYRDQQYRHLRTAATPFHLEPYSYFNHNTLFLEYAVSFEVLKMRHTVKLTRDMVQLLSRAMTINGSPSTQVRDWTPSPEPSPPRMFRPVALSGRSTPPRDLISPRNTWKKRTRRSKRFRPPVVESKSKIFQTDEPRLQCKLTPSELEFGIDEVDSTPTQ